MNKFFSRRWIAWTLTLCLLVGLTGAAGATQSQDSDFDTLKPFMDLVAASALGAGDEPEVVGNEETTLTPTFIAQFFNEALARGDAFGVTADLLANPDQQAAYLQKLFVAKLPTLEPIVQTEPVSGYIGFQPVTVNAGGEGDVQIVGELYWSTKPMSQMTDDEYKDITWLDRAVYTFRASADAPNGYQLSGFSVGSELNMEEAMQTYTESILVEYINTSLGFSVLYPSVFTDDLLVEDDTGVSATLPDNSVRFFVKRTDNSSNANLKDYVDVIANGLPNVKSTLNEEFSSATLAYDTEDGYAVFDIYIVTDKYIYQAELAYLKNLASTYQMYTAYLENSFAVDEVSVG